MKDEEKKIRKEDTTKYGEFIPSLDHWIPIEEQKRKAKELADITKNKKD